MVKNISDKAADLNQNYQNQATDGTKEGRQGVVGLVGSVGETAAAYIPSFGGGENSTAEKQE